MKTEFFQCNGATERHDEIVKISDNNYLVIIGYGVDADGNGYTNRRYYDHVPTEAELRADYAALINPRTDAKIATGFTWNGKPVYLSTENQSNFKTAYDLARDTNGANLPIRFKLGEDESGSPVYHTFTKFEVLQDFILKSADYVNTVLNDGWREKDGVDYETLIASVNE
nr:MAG TPA: protein of unknown function (DUF4376) [Caudoviricetes sp.]